MGSEMCIRDRKTVGDKLPETLAELQLDYSPYEEKINVFREKSFEYLNKVLSI